MAATLVTRIRSENLPATKGSAVTLPCLLSDGEREAEWERAINDPQSLIAIDLFCGAGGMSLGFEEAGFVVAAGLDADELACQTHGANLLSKSVHLDIGAVADPVALMSRLGIPRVDVIVGGPPCQGFSVAGISKLRNLAAHDPEVKRELDQRNALYKEFVEFVRVLQPLIFVMENVPNLSYFGQGVIANEIKSDFAAVGYQVDDEILNAAHFGVPQVRRRLFFIGSRIGRIWRTPNPAYRDRPRTLCDAIGDLPAVSAPALEERVEYTTRDHTDYQALMRSTIRQEDRGGIYDHIVRPVRDDDVQIFAMMQQGQTYGDVPEELRRYRADSFKDKYYKLRWDSPGNTITAHMAKDGYRYIHPEQLRTLSVREAARIQSFPDSFRFAGSRSSRYRQIGNAVPPLLARAIGKTLARAIRRHRQIIAGDDMRVFEVSSERDELWQLGLPGFE